MPAYGKVQYTKDQLPYYYRKPTRVGGAKIHRRLKYKGPAAGPVKSPTPGYLSPSGGLSGSSPGKSARARKAREYRAFHLGVTRGGPARRLKNPSYAKVKFAPTPFANRKRRTFKITTRGAYVIRVDNKSLYSRKARFIAGKLIKNLTNVPMKIRPKRKPRK